MRKSVMYMCGCMMYVCMYGCVTEPKYGERNHNTEEPCLFFRARQMVFMWQQDCRCASARARATTIRDACHHLLLPHLHQAAHRDLRRSRMRRSRRWSVTWLQHPVRQMLVALVVVLLVVSASENETVRADKVALRTVS